MVNCMTINILNNITTKLWLLLKLIPYDFYDGYVRKSLFLTYLYWKSISHLECAVTQNRTMCMLDYLREDVNE